MEIRPGIQAGTVAVIKDNLDGVSAYGLKLDDPHISLPPDKLFLSRSVPLDFGARAFDAKILGREVEAFARIKSDRQEPLVIL